MQEEKIAFTQVLQVSDAELYQIKDGETGVKARGVLQVLYSHSYDIFVLRIEDFKFALVKNLEIITTRSEKEGFRSYMLPCPGGSFIIKITNIEQDIALSNLDVILENTAHLLHRTGLEERLGGQHETKIVEEGALFASGINKIVDKVSKIVAPTSNESHANQKVLKTFEELKSVESSGVIVVDVSKDELHNLTDEAGEVARNHQEAPHWKNLKKDHTSESNSSLAGLTSQSMGVEEPNQPRVIFPDNTKASEQNEFDKATASTANKDLEISFSKPNESIAKNLELRTSDSLSSQKSWGSNVTNASSTAVGSENVMDSDTSATNQFIAKSLELKASDSLSSQKSWGSNISNAATSNIDSESAGGSDLGSEFNRVNLGSNKEIIFPSPASKSGKSTTEDS